MENDQELSGSTTIPGVFQRLRRLGGYAFWSAAGFVLPIGIDRLFVAPVLNRHLGADVFGGFVWMLGIVNLFGNVGANGFALLLLRNLATQPAPQAGRTLRTAFVLSGAVSAVILIVSAIGAYFVAGPAAQRNFAALGVTLVAFGALRSLGFIVNTHLRVERRFAAIFIVKSIEAGVLLLNLFVAPLRSLWLVGFVYVVSVVAPVPVAFRFSGGFPRRERWWDTPAARWLLVGWLAGASLTFVDQSQVYAARTFVGMLCSDQQVAVLYAGTSIGNVFVMPSTMLGALVLSLLARKTTFAFSGKRGFGYLGGVLGTATCVGLASFFLGQILLRLLYPDLAGQTMRFYHWIALANGCTTMMLLIRPVAVKYARLHKLSILSGFTLLVQIALLLVLIPGRQAAGAATALAGSAIVGMCLWLTYFVILWHRAPAVAGAGLDSDGSRNP